MRKLFILLFPILFLNSVVTADPQEDKAALEKLILSSTKAMSDYNKTKNKSAVLKHFHEKMLIDFTYISISGKVRNERIDFNEFAAHLDEISHGKMGFTHDVEIMRTYITGGIGVVSLTEDYEIKYNNEILNKGSQLITTTAKKFGTQWKIIRMTVIEVENEKLKGTCLCELFTGKENQGGDLIAKVTSPGGKSYNSDMFNFSFKKENKVKTIVKMEDVTYAWENSFAIWTTDADGNKIKQIGQGASESEVVKLLVSKEFTDHCTDFKIRQ